MNLTSRDIANWPFGPGGVRKETVKPRAERFTGPVSQRKRADALARMGVVVWRDGEAVSALIPIRMVGETNVRGSEHWAARKKRVDEHHAMSLRAIERMQPLPSLPVSVSFTRFAPRQLDHGDNLNSSFKSVRDALAQAYGVDDKSDLYHWRYGQARANDYAVVVRIESLNQGE